MAEQPPEQTPGTAAVGEEHPPDAEPPALSEALAWKGWKVDELGGSTVGRLEGVLVDADGGEPSWLFVRMGRFGHYTGLPYAHAVAGARHVWVPYPRDLVRQAPRLQAGAPVTREQELELCAHFGLPGSAGRAAELEKRDSESVTAQLAAAPSSG
jgi:hypothetical protein